MGLKWLTGRRPPGGGGNEASANAGGAAATGRRGGSGVEDPPPRHSVAVPFVPRISGRASYRLHKILDRNPAWEALASVVESSKPLYRGFTAIEERSKAGLYGCAMCGQCALPLTGFTCPMTCPKQLRNGPCGGVAADGGCEVYPEKRCVWVVAYERAAEAGHLDDLSQLQRPLDQRRVGESSWVNFWRGRDEEMAADPRSGQPLEILRARGSGGSSQAAVGRR
jgi:hypothetical protein